MNEFEGFEWKKESRKIRAEKKGRIIAIRLKTGEIIVGQVIKSNRDTLFIETLDEPRITKDVHRALIDSRLVLEEGGKKDNKWKKNKKRLN